MRKMQNVKIILIVEDKAVRYFSNSITFILKVPNIQNL